MRAARVLVRLRWIVVAAWVAATIALIVATPPTDGSGGGFQSLVPTDAEAITTRARSAELFAAPLLTETVIVQRREGGLSLAARQRVLDRAAGVNARHLPRGDAFRGLPAPRPLEGFPELALALPLINDRRVLPGAREDSTTALTYLYFPQRFGLETRDRVAHAFAAQYVDRPDDGLVGVTGAAPARVEQVRLISAALPWLHVATVLVISVVVGLHFRSLLAPLIALVAVGVSFLAAIRTVGWVGALTGYSLPQELEPLIVVLLLGVVTDYAIFYLAAYRAESRRSTGTEAVIRATAIVTPIVAVAALVVAAGTAALVVSRLDFFRVLGPGLAITVTSGMVVSVTLIPALIAVLRRAVLWPSSAARSAKPARVLRRLHPAHSIVIAAVLIPVVVAGLAALGTGAARIELGLPVVGDLPNDSEPAVAARAAQEGIAEGVLSPTVILLEQPGIVARQASLAALQDRLESERGVVGVLGPRERPAGVPLGAVYSSDGAAARIAIVLDVDPTSADGIAVMRRLRERLPRLLAASGLGDVRVSIGGNSALALETVDAISDDLIRVAIVAAGVNLVLLLLFLRGSVAAFGLLAASVLGLGAALGLAELIFVEWLGNGELAYYVPFAVAVLLVSLGSDYTIFLAGRIWQEARERSVRAALRETGAEASSPVTVAGLALASSFALLAIVPLQSFRELALAMSIGILLDAFVVRTLLVPALLNLLGERARWPARRRGGRDPVALPSDHATRGRTDASSI